MQPDIFLDTNLYLYLTALKICPLHKTNTKNFSFLLIASAMTLFLQKLFA